MDAPIKPFTRHISEKQMELLKATAARPDGAWLREALADPDLLFALRDGRVDVYFRGQVIYSIEFGTDKIATYTHVKYLLLDGTAPYIKMQDGTFAYKHAHLHDVYRDGVSLGQIKSAAKVYAGAESQGIYKAIKRDPSIIDVEIAFTRSNDIVEHSSQEKQRTQDRVDMVRLTPAGDGYDLVFWEAKDYSYKDVFNDKIFNQLTAYAKQLEIKATVLNEAYRNVCQFHLDLHRLRESLGFAGAAASQIEMLDNVARGRCPLRIVKKPSLFVFGFDNDQKNGRWKVRKQEIEAVIGGERLRAVGNPTDWLGSAGKGREEA
ncbi:hypothetical protein [Rhizobium leguminosarum]|uniref:hypothetical protein n=1 Tax=Rhizobium leguminosarum TaxID=384 RepID=UPI001C90A595|nr:hypothetical protein [Rhizobium leguminosarum]MBY3044836.1 hypothetical protein [Rhizobium leguminosarum]